MMIDWDQHYGTAFKLVHTPDNDTVSIVTPENGDAWNWTEVSPELRAHWKSNWAIIQRTLYPYKRQQIINHM
jgi:hypothetical protein